MTQKNIILIALPALLIALYQTQIVWKRLIKREFQNQIPKSKYSSHTLFLFVIVKYLTYLLFIIQLFYVVIPITNNISFKIVLISIGYIFILSGFFMSLLAINKLGNSWSSMMFYKINDGQKLTTSGIYKFVRHPIYGSVVLEVVGYELVANSWFFMPLLLSSLTILNLHIRNEEKLLVEHFGGRYLKYKRTSKKLIPFIY